MKTSSQCFRRVCTEKEKKRNKTKKTRQEKKKKERKERKRKEKKKKGKKRKTKKNKQIIYQTNKETNEQRNKHTNEQTKEQTNKQTARSHDISWNVSSPLPSTAQQRVRQTDSNQLVQLSKQGDRTSQDTGSFLLSLCRT